ncbi:GNAT family N-acetyltransferase [Parabacteroides sp. PF5-9]|uniref:GNAT family N-acetyltransferase n=1 Tax=Parabacteroides sp. PF5-9 TaxID=1742404 RepID=UPI002476E3DE|nr:GNAT family N-acetyltransferase [Parabacteroides sp. PF5-9]MDH6357851.1 ribosomal protein S18 acetylase RimI-like enzyme [Parabacteroides sp. PF5-9]
MFSIQTADKNDRFLIHQLASRIWPHTYGAILPQEQLNYMLEMMYAPENILHQMVELHHQYFIFYSGDQPAGYLSIETMENNSYIFQKIYALPEMQGTGLGRYMIEQGISFLKKNHPTPFTISLYVNRENKAVGFYKHMGFEIIDTRDHHIGNNYYMNDYIMAMHID